MRRPLALALSGSLALALALGVTGTTGAAPPTPPSAADPDAKGPPKNPTAVGSGGAVSSVDPNATRIGLRVLKRGGNAVDAAVATAAALGVAEPYSAGVGGGGYFVYYDARSGRVRTIDGRETAPLAIPQACPHAVHKHPACRPPRRAGYPQTLWTSGFPGPSPGPYVRAGGRGGPGVGAPT